MFPSLDETHLAKENEQGKGFATSAKTTTSLERYETALTKVLWPRYEKKSCGTPSCNWKITRQESNRQKKNEISLPFLSKRHQIYQTNWWWQKMVSVFSCVAANVWAYRRGNWGREVYITKGESFPQYVVFFWLCLFGVHFFTFFWKAPKSS